MSYRLYLVSVTSLVQREDQGKESACHKCYIYSKYGIVGAEKKSG